MRWTRKTIGKIVNALRLRLVKRRTSWNNG
jgi:hypothetical protein